MLTDLWKDDAPAFGLNNSWACDTSHQEGCLYEDYLFNKYVVDAIQAHDPATPLYLYYAPHAVSLTASCLFFLVSQPLHFVYIGTRSSRGPFGAAGELLLY